MDIQTQLTINVSRSLGIKDQLAIIKESNRLEQIKTYTTICSCGFEFMPMTHWVKEGNSFCECGDCGEVLLIE